PCGTCTLSIQCRNYSPGDMTSMNAELWISNTGDQPIPLSMIKVRYYYTNEGGPMTLEIFDKAFRPPDGSAYVSATASFSMTNGKLAKPAMDFSEIAVTGPRPLDGTIPFYFKMAIHDLNHSKLILTNDYSNPPMALGPCPTIVALVGNAVAGGIPPR
ncbi:MAG TPA: cellulose binding domain-containing protein, partial [Polyangia bacterium]